MIAKVNQIAKDQNISFAKVVRDAVDAFESNNSDDDAMIMDTLADTMINTTNEIVKKFEEVEKRLDKTHAYIGE